MATGAVDGVSAYPTSAHRPPGRHRARHWRLRNSDVNDQTNVVPVLPSCGISRPRRGGRCRAVSFRASTTRRRFSSPTAAWSLAAAVILQDSASPNTAPRSSLLRTCSKGARPTISAAPSQANYSQSFFVGTSEGGRSRRSLSSRSRPSLTGTTRTPGYVPLTFSQTSGGLNVTAPPNGCVAPPGHVHAVRGQRQRCAVRGHMGARLRGEPADLDSAAETTGGGQPGRSRSALSRARLPPPAPTAPPPVSPPSVFGSLRPGATSGESATVSSYAKKIVCTLNRSREASLRGERRAEARRDVRVSRFRQTRSSSLAPSLPPQKSAGISFGRRR